MWPDKKVMPYQLKKAVNIPSVLTSGVDAYGKEHANSIAYAPTIHFTYASQPLTESDEDEEEEEKNEEQKQETLKPDDRWVLICHAITGSITLGNAGLWIV